MKNIYLLILSIIFLYSCSTDSDELDISKENLYELNSVVEINGCSPVSYNFTTVGNIEVINDDEYLYVTISAVNDYYLTQTRLHIVNNFMDFPGNGNLPPGKMDYSQSFSSSTTFYTYKFSLSNYFSNNDKILIASNSSFSDGNSSSTAWAGDIIIKKGNWAYFEYTIQECTPPCTISAGESHIKTLTYSEAAALPSWDEVRKLYLSLLDPGVSRLGTFNPSIWDLINKFQAQKLGDFTTIYTLTDGECSDSVELTLRVIPD